MPPERSIPTLACTAPFGFTEDPARILAAFAALGCTTCQYCRRVDDPLDAASRRASSDIAFALRTADRAGLQFDSIHGVFSERVNPSSPDPDHRAACLAIYDDEARLARSLGGTMIVVHPGAINPARVWRTPSDAAIAQAASAPHLADFLPRLAEIGHRLGVTFLIENLPYSCTNGFDPRLLASQVRAVRSTAIRMCFDTGHAHCTVPSVADAIIAGADVISYFHIHDNLADADSHLIPGDGSIDWTAVAASLQSNRATRMLELFQPASTLALLASTDFPNRLTRWLLTPPEQVA